MPWKKVRLSGQRGYWAQVDENNEPIDLDENGNIRVYDAPDGKQVALGEQVKPAYITRERDDKFAAQERARQIDEHVNRNQGALADLFGNLISGGMASEVTEGAGNLRRGNYVKGTAQVLSPLMFMSGPLGIMARTGIGTYNLANENGVRKTWDLAQQGQYGRAALSGVGDILNGLLTVEGYSKVPQLLENAATRYGQGVVQDWGRARTLSRAINQGIKDTQLESTFEPIVRTKVGDVEINNPELYYHQSSAGKAQHFMETGRMRTPTEEYWLAKEAAGEHIPVQLRTGIKPGYPQVPGRAMFSQGSLWYGFDPRGNPDLLVTAKEMPIATRKAGIMSDKASLKKLESQGSRRVTDDNIYGQGPHNTQNTSAYTWEPGYGYRQVSEQPPTYNHPGAFLGNTVKRNGGITVNGEGVLRKPYQTPNTRRISGTTREPLMSTDKGREPITVNGKQVLVKAFEPEGKTLSYGADGAAHNLFVNNQKVSSNADNVSLKFFERKPSRISFAERLGISKSDRGNLNQFQKDALEDLEQYINSGQYRQLPTINMETAEPSWVSRRGSVSALKQLIDDGIPSSGRNSWAWNRPNGGTYELVTDGNGNFGIGYNSYRMFDVSPEFNVRVGEASAGSAKHGYSKIFLTAPKNDARHFITETPEQELAKKTLIETQSPRISKNIMRDFWSGVQQSLRPGAYLSGDEGMLPKGATLIRQFKELSSKGYRKDNNGNIIGSGRTNWEDIRNSLMRPEKWKRREDGLSTDSYLALLKQANRENSPYYLRYSPDGFTTFNSQSIDNKFISDLLEKTKTGEATQQEFLDAFHNWVSPYGGMDAKIVNGEIVIPHPFLYKKKQGGKINKYIINKTEKI